MIEKAISVIGSPKNLVDKLHTVREQHCTLQCVGSDKGLPPGSVTKWS